MKSIVVIVAKEPVAGCVKTRLCPPLSPAEAADLYALFILDMVEEMSRTACSPHEVSRSSHLALAYTPESSAAAFQAVLPPAVSLFPQQGMDLGERLAAIFDILFAQDYDQVHIINSDSPDLPHTFVQQAIHMLAGPQTDLVLGPSHDGGYYLIGLKRPAARLFKQIPWSTERVLETTLGRARAINLSVALLDPWYDIDRFEDLLMFLERNQSRRKKDAMPGRRTFNFLLAKMSCRKFGNANRNDKNG